MKGTRDYVVYARVNFSHSVIEYDDSGLGLGGIGVSVQEVTKSYETARVLVKKHIKNEISRDPLTGLPYYNYTELALRVRLETDIDARMLDQRRRTVPFCMPKPFTQVVPLPA